MTLKEFFKKPINKLIAESLILCGIIFSVYVSFLNNKEIYKGHLREYDEVIYQEGKFSLRDKDRLNENAMILKKGKTVYFLEDIFNETSINRNPEFKRDVLERVVKITGDKREEITAPDKLIEYSKLYNDLREDIIRKINERSFGERAA